MHVNEQIVPPLRLELKLYALEVRCFIQLSYGGITDLLREEAIPFISYRGRTLRLRICYVLGAGIEPARSCLSN